MLLTLYYKTSQRGTRYLQPPPNLVDEKEKFNVENILGHHHFGKWHKLQYIIKWKGYLTADNTVGEKTILMFGYFAKIEVEQIKKIR